jgi:hypothetical protein
MAAKDTSKSTTPAKADAKAQDAAEDETLEVTPVPAEAHFLGTDALAGEPGQHGVPVAPNHDPDEPEGDTDEYWQNDHRGTKVYQCRRCQFNTMSLEDFRLHWQQRHTPQVAPPPEVKFPQFDRFGNYVPETTEPATGEDAEE